MNKFDLTVRRVIVGHRGVGKTHLLSRSKQYFPEVKHFDLDYEISHSQKRSPSEIFLQSGESEFRRIEAEVFEKIITQNQNFVIACGAGFDPSRIDSSIEVMFVSRLTDADGRIFLDRPRLNPAVTQLEEYGIRYQERHERFIKRADKIYHMPEGIESPNEIEKKIMTGGVELSSAVYTVQTRDCRKVFSETFNYFELRNDLLTDEQIEEFKKNNSNARLMYSIRRNCNVINFEDYDVVDCDIQFASEFKWPGAQLKIVSSHRHEVGEAIDELNQFQKSGASVGLNDLHFKLCPKIESFDQLIKGHEWQAEDPNRRSFLPRSEDGRWVWYRLIKSFDQKLNYVKSSSEVADQPSVYEFLTLPPHKPEHWGAVLGDPVYFSRSPEQHRSFFAEFSSFFTRIKLNERELAENLFFLQGMGLKYAAVTSPLKETLFKISDVQSTQANELKSANTMLLEDDFILVHNTDLDGFKNLTSMLRLDSKIAVWGGGGTLNMMMSVLPGAHYYSSQTADRRIIAAQERSAHAKNVELENVEVTEYDFLIWAAPRRPETKWPPQFLKCKTVIDLNYTEFSMGLEYAAKNKLNYISGLTMFREQARKQQLYWIQGVKS